MQTIDSQISDLERNLITQRTLCKVKSDRLQEVEKQLDEVVKKFELYKKSAEFLARFSNKMRESVGSEIESLVTQVLHKVLKSEQYSFKIVFEQKRGVVEANFFLHDKISDNLMDIVDACGGGVGDIVSVILQFVFSEIFNPLSDFIIFDEAGKFISEDKQAEFFSLLKSLSEEYKKQVIYVSHEKEILNVADNVIKLV